MMSETFSPIFWPNGPGNLINFPKTTPQPSDYRQFSQSPITTTTSILGLIYDNGVIIAGDTLGSYGSLARYRNCPRISKINDNIIMGASGDYADYQYVKDLIDQKIIDEICLDDGFKLKPKSLYCWLTRIMYNRRSRMNPFWNNFVVGGFNDDNDEPFLGTIDKLGTAFTDKIICTGYGAHMVTPLFRAALEKNPKLNKTEARDLIEKGLEVLYYRDARSYPKYHVATIDRNDGILVEGPLILKENWSAAHNIKSD